MKEACEHGGAKGLDFAYGNGTALDFGRQYVAILKKYAAKHDLSDYLAPMEHIVRTNETDGRVLAKLCPTAKDTAHFIETYNPDVLADPFMCYGMLRDKGLLPVPAAATHETPAERQYPAALAL